MPLTEQIIDGVQLALLGMAVVFVFLGILILLMLLMSWIAHRFEQVATTAVPTPPLPVRDSGVDPNIVPVIAAAVASWRRRHVP